MPAHLFITGTDTGVGKTVFASWLVRAWLAAGHAAAGLKPVEAGGRDDARALHEAGRGILTPDEVNAVSLPEALAPAQSTETAGRAMLDRANAAVTIARGRFTHLAVEGAGGWLVPLGDGLFVRDWARELSLPVVVVARPWLGTLNHTLLTVESIRAAGCTCDGIVVNSMLPGGPADDASRTRNADSLRALAGAPVFEFLGHGQPFGDAPAWLGGEEG